MYDVNERYRTLQVSRFARGLSHSHIAKSLHDMLELYPPQAIDVATHDDDTVKGFALLRFGNHASARNAMDILRRSYVVKYTTDKPVASRADKTLHSMRERLKRATEMNLFYQAFLEQHGFVIDAEGRPSLQATTFAGDAAPMSSEVRLEKEEPDVGAVQELEFEQDDELLRRFDHLEVEEDIGWDDLKQSGAKKVAGAQ
jgi:hypothetical protein